MKAENMQVRQKYSSLSDTDLSVIIKEISNEHPNAGYREIKSLLATRYQYTEISAYRDLGVYESKL